MNVTKFKFILNTFVKRLSLISMHVDLFTGIFVYLWPFEFRRVLRPLIPVISLPQKILRGLSRQKKLTESRYASHLSFMGQHQILACLNHALVYLSFIYCL